MNHGAPQTVQPRLGQGTFRIAGTSAYGACAALGHALAARARGRAGAPLRGRRRTRAAQPTAPARRHPPLLRRRLRHRHAGLPLPRQPRPRRRLPQAAASTSVLPAAPSPCPALSWTSPILSCSIGTRRRCSAGKGGAPPACSHLGLPGQKNPGGFASAAERGCLHSGSAQAVLTPARPAAGSPTLAYSTTTPQGPFAG